ncbi:hypothetical protein [Cellulomonas edaphi]|uniref:PucR family transcriptional regulator n=1 Tax=Cellulomonas edaphi TaxID=3053468 RepID=A0ABT7S6F1_9CELL|nr:hypothetical protein [Cellulomons edaphi]MDM7831171.1 hypothetical protein [Cellulomons edaphi]
MTSAHAEADAQAGGESWRGPWEDSGPDDDLAVSPGGPLRGPDDVLDFLLRLIGPERAGRMALWCALVDDDDRTLPIVLPVSDIPVRPDTEMLAILVAQLGELLREHVHADDGGLVFGLVRRTGGDRGEVELSWSAALRHAADRAGVRLRAVAVIGRDRARVLQW